MSRSKSRAVLNKKARSPPRGNVKGDGRAKLRNTGHTEQGKGDALDLWPLRWRHYFRLAVPHAGLTALRFKPTIRLN